MTISLTQKKKAYIKRLCHEALYEQSFCSAFGPLHYRLLVRDKIFAIKFAKGNFHKNIEVLQVGKLYILWLINNIEDAFNPI